MVRKAEWDSKFFNYPVGYLKINEKEKFDLQKFIVESENYKLVYIISEIYLEENSTIKLMDKKVVYSKTLSKAEHSVNILEFSPETHSYDQLLELAYLSGIFSRFNRDNKFKNNEFKILYKEWLDSSINKKLSFKVLIRQLEGKIAGFVSLNKKDNQIAEIGLIAVQQQFQGRKIGTELIQECEFLSLEQNLRSIEVATQYENSSARRLYEKNDFSFKSITYVYHYWNL